MEKPTSNNEKAPSITLEMATGNDIDAYLAIETGLQGVPTYSVTENREQALEEIEKNTLYLIRDNGHIVGRIAYQMKSPDHAYISDLVIHPDFRGSGIGTAAMKKVLEEFGDIPTIDLVTHPDNVRAVQLYQSLGFTVGERVENYFGDGEPRVVMTLQH